MRRILTFFAGVLIAFPAMAQFSAGVRTDAVFSDVAFRGGLETVGSLTESVTTPRLGIFGEYALNNRFGVRLGMNYLNQGVAIDRYTHVNLFELPIPIGARMTFNTKQLEIPVSAVYYHKLGVLEGYALAGVGLSQTVHAELRPQVTALFDFNLPAINIPTESFNNTTFYGHTGMGIAYPLAHGKIFLEGQYQHSFESIKPDFLVDLDMKSKGFSVGIGYAMSF